MKPALLVIDVQKQFFEFGPTTAQSLDDAIEYINAAIENFRVSSPIKSYRAKSHKVVSVWDRIRRPGALLA